MKPPFNEKSRFNQQLLILLSFNLQSKYHVDLQAMLRRAPGSSSCFLTPSAYLYSRQHETNHILMLTATVFLAGFCSNSKEKIRKTIPI